MTTVPASRLTLLRTIPSLTNCNDDELAALAVKAGELEVPASTTLVAPGQLGGRSYVVLEGWAAITVRGEPVAAVGPGQAITDATVSDVSPSGAGVVAKTAMRVLVVADIDLPGAFPFRTTRGAP